MSTTTHEPLSEKDAALYVADTIQRYRLGDIDADEYRECMAYVRGRTDARTYEQAKARAIASEVSR